MPGVLIALEGIDGAGTTSQARALVEWLERRGREALLTAEPSGGAIGRLIREALAGRLSLRPPALALLFAADRLDHLARQIEPALERGQIVVSDRYVFSSLAYQSLDSDPGWVETINGLARPADLVLLLDAPVEVCLERVQARDGSLKEIFESESLLLEIRRRYLDLARERSRRGERVVVIDAAAPLEQVREAVLSAAARTLGMGPVG